MRDKTFLMIPGPTPVPESALIEMAKHPMAHRSKEFSNILKEVYEDLKYVFQTKNDVYLKTLLMRVIKYYAYLLVILGQDGQKSLQAEER